MNKMYNWKVWTWDGWLIIKWPFGIIFGLFIIWQVICLETIPNYDKKVLNNMKSTIDKTISSFDVLKHVEIKSTPIKNLK